MCITGAISKGKSSISAWTAVPASRGKWMGGTACPQLMFKTESVHLQLLDLTIVILYYLVIKSSWKQVQDLTPQIIFYPLQEKTVKYIFSSNSPKVQHIWQISKETSYCKAAGFKLLIRNEISRLFLTTVLQIYNQAHQPEKKQFKWNLHESIKDSRFKFCNESPTRSPCNSSNAPVIYLYPIKSPIY